MELPLREDLIDCDFTISDSVYEDFLMGKYRNNFLSTDMDKSYQHSALPLSNIRSHPTQVQLSPSGSGQRNSIKRGALIIDIQARTQPSGLGGLFSLQKSLQGAMNRNWQESRVLGVDKLFQTTDINWTCVSLDIGKENLYHIYLAVETTKVFNVMSALTSVQGCIMVPMKTSIRKMRQQIYKTIQILNFTNDLLLIVMEYYALEGYSRKGKLWEYLVGSLLPLGISCKDVFSEDFQLEAIEI